MHIHTQMDTYIYSHTHSKSPKRRTKSRKSTGPDDTTENSKPPVAVLQKHKHEEPKPDAAKALILMNIMTVVMPLFY